MWMYILLGFKSMWMACKVFSFFDVGAKYRYYKLYSSECVSRGLYNWGNISKKSFVQQLNEYVNGEINWN